MAERSLTGAWSGAYQYPGNAGPETVFNALIEEHAGRFTGSTTEPNLLRPWLGGVVSADIDGIRNGMAVRFSKFMDGSGGMSHAILYEGAADAELTRIDGRWSIPGDWSGTFFMIRDDQATQAIELEAEVAERRRA